MTALIWAAIALLVAVWVLLYRRLTRDDPGTRAAPREPSRWQRARAHRWRIGDAWDRATARAGYWWRRAQAAAGIDLTARYRRRYLTPADAHTAALFERMNGHRQPEPVTWQRWAIAATIAALAVITQAAGSLDYAPSGPFRDWERDSFVGGIPVIRDGA